MEAYIWGSLQNLATAFGALGIMAGIIVFCFWLSDKHIAISASILIFFIISIIVVTVFGSKYEELIKQCKEKSTVTCVCEYQNWECICKEVEAKPLCK